MIRWQILQRDYVFLLFIYSKPLLSGSIQCLFVAPVSAPVSRVRNVGDAGLHAPVTRRFGTVFIARFMNSSDAQGIEIRLDHKKTSSTISYIKLYLSTVVEWTRCV